MRRCRSCGATRHCRHGSGGTCGACAPGSTRLGFTIGPTESPIVPIVVGDAERTVVMWRALLEAGLYANIVLPPACRPDACVLRTSYSAAHTPEQIDRALATFEQVGRALAIIDAAA